VPFISAVAVRISDMNHGCNYNFIQSCSSVAGLKYVSLFLPYPKASALML
jgi:hypothetical protein